MKQADCSLGFELLRLDVQVRDLNKTFRLGLLEHRDPPMLLATIYLLANPEKLGHRIAKFQRCVYAAIALKPSDEILEMRWGSSGAVSRCRLIRGYEWSARVLAARDYGWNRVDICSFCRVRYRQCMCWRRPLASCVRKLPLSWKVITCWRQRRVGNRVIAVNTG